MAVLPRLKPVDVQKLGAELVIWPGGRRRVFLDDTNGSVAALLEILREGTNEASQLPTAMVHRGFPVTDQEIADALVTLDELGILSKLTGMYALFVAVTGCRNLWETKGALAGRLIRRATPTDLRLLDSTPRREILRARFYLCLYVPGVLGRVCLYRIYRARAVEAHHYVMERGEPGSSWDVYRSSGRHIPTHQYRLHRLSRMGTGAHSGSRHWAHCQARLRMSEPTRTRRNRVAPAS